MKKFSIKLTFPTGEIRETWIDGENESDAGQRFFRRKGGAEHLGQGEVKVEITEAIDTPKAEDYTREILIGLCEDGMTPMKSWFNRDSYSAHTQLGVALAMLKCEVPFRVEKAEPDTVWVEFYDIEGFNYHELGGDEVGNYDTETAYIPTRHRLEKAEGKDWY